MGRIIAIDTETTGLTPEIHTICEIAIIIIDEDGTKKEWETKIELSQRELEGASSAAMKINGFNQIGWQESMNPVEAAEKICQLLTGPFIWVGHNPYFDKRFVQYFLMRHLGMTKAWRDLRFVDTRQLATASLAAYYPHRIAHFSLDSIRRFLGWKVHDTHAALTDTRDSLLLFQMFCNPYQASS